jgi:hypothetical protein
VFRGVEKKLGYGLLMVRISLFEFGRIAARGPIFF